MGIAGALELEVLRSNKSLSAARPCALDAIWGEMIQQPSWRYGVATTGTLITRERQVAFFTVDVFAYEDNANDIITGILHHTALIIATYQRRHAELTSLPQVHPLRLWSNLSTGLSKSTTLETIEER
ncbi:uncharacterized protein M437DRAFT_62530 [Aureobasidium melanogenum CBS 110374]|uniref:Uncharacterized protein n=1 Tax=Aureobasidium melanogenum (strain CBS 110374) TaxID=1043003 RepID=A0A074WV85_AURM1|nr:uncharacterized protein M437DRAFT_62530 [Aureobasidium melanogenum CBS 110374]KEQ66316.1 hypothetical protein M437DRAFT_62530 [Aureobasidium melanogenum CBS 110374]